jgi:hypothetical protein
MYTVLSLLYIFLMLRRIDHGADELTLAESQMNEPAVLPAREVEHAF